MEHRNSVGFNRNVFGIAGLLAVVICAVGASSGDATVQWVASGLVLLVGTGAAVLWPERRRPKPSKGA